MHHSFDPHFMGFIGMYCLTGLCPFPLTIALSMLTFGPKLSYFEKIVSILSSLGVFCRVYHSPDGFCQQIFHSLQDGCLKTRPKICHSKKWANAGQATTQSELQISSS